MDSSTLQQLYQLLFDRFGSRRWWPAETPFEVIVGAILTQNVAWKNVEKAIANLKGAGLLDPAALYAVSAGELEPLIRSTGYFRAKAKKLKAFVAHLHERYDGSLERMWTRPLAELRAELLAIYGIGPETADAILCYAGGYPVMVVDAYTRRVFCRLGLASPAASYGELQRLFMANLPPDARLFNEYHALIDALAHGVCLKRAPLCGRCPLAGVCREAGISPSAAAAAVGVPVDPR